MAVSLNHSTKVFSVPQSDLTLVTGSLYECDTNWLRLQIHAILASVDGIVEEDAVIHNTEVTVAGTTFARTMEITNGFKVEFTPDSQWSVRLANSNNNIFDVENGILVQNQVQVIAQNSGGLIVSDQTGLTQAESSRLADLWRIHGLEVGQPVVHTDTTIDANGISQTVIESPPGTVTVERS